MRQVVPTILLLVTGCVQSIGERSVSEEQVLAACDFEGIFDGDFVVPSSTVSLTIDGVEEPDFTLGLGFQSAELLAFACRADGWFQHRYLVYVEAAEQGPGQVASWAYTNTLTDELRAGDGGSVAVSAYALESSASGGSLELAMVGDGIEVDWDVTWSLDATVEEDPFADW